MSIKTKILSIVLGLALVAVIVPAGASAAALTSTQISAIIGLLQSFGADATTVANVTASLNGTPTTITPTPVPTGSVACAGVTFTRNLLVGSTGQDVKCLQVLLNTNGYTLAATGAGSPGMETSYFGPRTLAVVRQFQAAKGMVPANQVGPLTRAALNALLGGGGVIITPPPAQTGSVSATVASDTPASGALIGSQATADLLHVNFSGTGTVTSVTLQRSGISTQNTLSNVYLYDGATRLTDGYSFNVNGSLTMNGLSIPVNGTHVISVKADTAAYDATASSVAVTLTGFTANGTTASANATGNLMMIVPGSAASAYMTTNNAAATANVNAGTSQYTLWSDSVQVNTRTIQLKGMNFKMIGSAPTNALSNIKLFIDGVDAGSVATISSIQGSNYAMFNFASPISLATGSHTIDIRADIVAGAYRTIQLSVQQAADVTLYDPQVGVNIAIQASSTATFVADSGTTVSILAGSSTVVIDPTFASATNITAGATNAVIGKYVIHGYGEDVKVSSLQVTPAITVACTTGTTYSIASLGTATGDCDAGLGYATGNGLQNVTLYLNGSQVGSSQNFVASTLTFQLGSQMIIPAGQDSILEIKADLQTSSNIAYTAGTVAVTLEGALSNAQGQSSSEVISVPTADQVTTGLTIESASLIVAPSPSFAATSVSPNTVGAKIGSYIVQNNSTSESVQLTSLLVKILDTDGTALGTAPAITNFSALRTSDTTGSGATPIQPTGSDTFSVNDVLAPGASITIDIFANTASDNSSSFITKLTVASIGVSSHIVDSNANGEQTGVTITLGVGSIAQPTLVTSTTTPAQYIASGNPAPGVAQSQATFNFISTTSAATINELRFTVSSAVSNTVTRICVGTACTTPVSGTATLTGLNLAVPISGGLTQNVGISYAPVGTSGIAPGTTTVVGLSYVKYTSGGSTKTLSSSATAGINTLLSPVPVNAPSTAGVYTLVGSVPTVTVGTGTSTLTIGGGLNKIGSVTVKADAQGAVKVRQIVFALASSGFDGSGHAITDTPGTTPFLTLAGQSTQITGNYCDIVAGSVSTGTITCELGGSGNTTYANDFLVPAGQSQTFDLYAAVGGAAASTSTKASISTSLTAASFLWDDTSTNGGTGSTGLAGTLVPNFPTTSSYTISQ